MNVVLTKLLAGLPLYLCSPQQVAAWKSIRMCLMRKTKHTTLQCFPSPPIPDNDFYSFEGLTLETNHTKLWLCISNCPDPITSLFLSYTEAANLATVCQTRMILQFGQLTTRDCDRKRPYPCTNYLLMKCWFFAFSKTQTIAAYVPIKTLWCNLQKSRQMCQG